METRYSKPNSPVQSTEHIALHPGIRAFANGLARDIPAGVVIAAPIPDETRSLELAKLRVLSRNQPAFSKSNRRNPYWGL